MTAPTTRYSIAPNGIFWSLQGEAHLRGFQMAFLRLAGCSVGCPGCDTDYSVAERLEVSEIIERIAAVMPVVDRDQWVWITGGEPTDRDLRPLLNAIKARGWSTALATSGANRHIPPVDWLSVSPHWADETRFLQRYGNEIKLIEGLNGVDLDAWIAAWDTRIDFMYRYVQPLSKAVVGGDGKTISHYVEDSASLRRCLDFLKRHPRWGLSRQDHHHWSVA